MYPMFFLRVLKRELEYCKFILKQLEGRIPKLPKGKIHLGKSHNSFTYYLVDKEHKRKYLNKDNKFISELCTRECAEKCIPKLKKAIKILTELVDLLENDNWRDFESYIHPEKLKLADFVYCDKKFYEEWQAKPYFFMKPTETPAGLVNNRQMRSKSEAIIAETLYSMGLYYRYEEEVILPNGESVCPDFTILDPYTHEEIYFEHFGKIDEEKYAASTFQKIKTYAQNGIYLNERLFCTFETANFHFPFECLKPFLEKKFGIK